MLPAKRQALEEFARWKGRYEDLASKAIACFEKDLDETLCSLIFSIEYGPLLAPPISLSGPSESFLAGPRSWMPFLQRNLGSGLCSG